MNRKSEGKRLDRAMTDYFGVKRRRVPRSFTCIGCGCTDDRACLDGLDQPCHWIAVDVEGKLGVCSQCPKDLRRFDAGDRTVRTKASA